VASVPADSADAPRDDDGADLIANARRRHGTIGAALAAGMLGLEKVLGRKPREEAPIVMAAPTDPTDIDEDGIVVPLDGDLSVLAPAQPRPDPYARRRARRPRRR
jgi:hypothetical protein